ncbi:hypothetical protein FQN60_008922 [Etheostoma spectabile]|uniref:Amino acid transporter transmembrane domain-containing protein n=1 Tax=Etheostoma spectabile TaxID=54343 RepID=A0A5J5CJZ9_9PERO|nr:hypothetical protein FQN60_008922 [Etheostoma spectabile]
MFSSPAITSILKLRMRESSNICLTYEVLVWELVVPQVHVCDVSHPAEPRGKPQLIVLQLLSNTEGPQSFGFSFTEEARTKRKSLLSSLSCTTLGTPGRWMVAFLKLFTTLFKTPVGTRRAGTVMVCVKASLSREVIPRTSGGGRYSLGSIRVFTAKPEQTEAGKEAAEQKLRTVTKGESDSAARRSIQARCDTDTRGSVRTRAQGASFTSSVFNLMNAIMGSGILGLAYAMANTGIVFFCLLLVLVSSLAAYSIHLLLKLCDQTGINSYEDLGERALQKPGKVLVGISIIIQNIGVFGGWNDPQEVTLISSLIGCLLEGCLSPSEADNFLFPTMSSYLFILKSELPVAIDSFLNPDSIGHAWYEDGRMLLMLVTLFVVLPLSMLTKIDRSHTLTGFLGYTSSICFFFMLYFAIVVVIKKFSIPCPLPYNVTTLPGALQISNSSDSECTPKLFIMSSKSGYAIPTMAFSFLCHTAILPIYCELDRPTKAKMQNITNVSISLSFLVYLISALFGYLTFYGNVDSELLLGYNRYMPRDIIVMVVRLAILLSVLLTVPLIHFPARKAATLLLFGRRPFSWLIHIIATLTILGVVLLLAIFVPNIRNVFGVVGSTTSTCLMFVFPGIFYLKINRGPLRSFDSIGAVLLVVIGFIMGIISFSFIVITWVHNS